MTDKKINKSVNASIKKDSNVNVFSLNNLNEINNINEFAENHPGKIINNYVHITNIININNNANDPILIPNKLRLDIKNDTKRNSILGSIPRRTSKSFIK